VTLQVVSDRHPANPPTVQPLVMTNRWILPAIRTDLPHACFGRGRVGRNGGSDPDSSTLQVRKPRRVTEAVNPMQDVSTMQMACEEREDFANFLDELSSDQ
jgi:hypothetical protein